ncbi:MAG: hypothetical protein Q9212_005550 [Teloschistes hypoglaucus]
MFSATVRQKPVPFPECFSDVDEYVESTLDFISSSELFQKICGGVHILEFLTQDPDLYTALLPSDWRQFFESRDLVAILDLLLRDGLPSQEPSGRSAAPFYQESRTLDGLGAPDSLFHYIKQIRQHILDRQKDSSLCNNNLALPRHVAVGMNSKKMHEVSNLSAYVDNLVSDLSSQNPGHISHLVDFGSGQNYLGRALASPAYNKKVIAIESKPLNIDGARSMDVTAKLAKKEVILRNKKQYRSEQKPEKHSSGNIGQAFDAVQLRDAMPVGDTTARNPCPEQPTKSARTEEDSNIQYIQSIIQGGDLSSLLPYMDKSSTSSLRLLVVSLHSCGNLLHHGLRSLVINPSVHAVALVGCCYNLLTERLPPPSSQGASLRSPNLRLEQTSSACDPHGFPISERLANYKHRNGSTGIRFNVTARMMAVQAPGNWTEKECNSFFTRHFYRALFQKILVDKGVVDAEVADSEDILGKRGGSPKVNPIVLGSLRKACYTSFILYVRAAIEKLKADPNHASSIEQHLADLTDEEILRYETEYGHKKKQLSIVWSLMAFSAQVVESVIVVDRWQWLREQREVKECWVENIFDYGISPRNLVVVGVKG